jgi:hypothetical protein
MSVPSNLRKLSQATILIAGIVAAGSYADAQPAGTAEKSDAEVGKWQTWVLSAGSQFRLPGHLMRQQPALSLNACAA